MNKSQKMPRGGVSLLSVMLIALLWSHAQKTYAQANDETLKKRFLEEAPSRWEEHHHQLGQYQGLITFQFEQIGSNGSAIQESERIEYKTNGKSKMLVKQSLAGSAESTVHAINPKYAFILRRKPRGNAWLVVKVERSKLDNAEYTETAKEVARVIDLYRTPFFKMTELGNERLTEVIRKPYFQILRASPIQYEGENLVEIAFDYRHTFEKGKPEYNMVQAGSMILDPQRFWCIRRLDLKLKSLVGVARETSEIELVGPTMPFPLPKRAVTKANWSLTAGKQAGKARTTSYQWEFDLKKPSSLPSDEEFTLTAFGLPEPPGLEWKRPTPWYLWVGLAGIVCLALGVGGRWLKQRMTASRR